MCNFGTFIQIPDFMPKYEKKMKIGQYLGMLISEYKAQNDIGFSTYFLQWGLPKHSGASYGLWIRGMGNPERYKLWSGAKSCRKSVRVSVSKAIWLG